LKSAKGKTWIIYNSATQQRSEPMSHDEMQLGLLTIKLKEIDSLFIWTPGWEKWQPLRPFLSSDQKYFIGVNADLKYRNIDVNAVPKFSESTVETATNIPLDSVTAIPTSKSSPKNAEDLTRTDPEISPLEALKKFRAKTTKKKSETTASEETTGPRTPEKSEFTKLVDPSQFEITDRNEEHFKKDLDGDEMLSEGALEKIDFKKIEFELRPTERTYQRRAERHAFKIEVILMLPSGKSLRSFSKNISLTGTLIEDNIPVEFRDKSFDVLLSNRLESDPKKAKLSLKAQVVGKELTTRRLAFVNLNDHMLDQLEAMISSYLAKQEVLQKKSS